MKKESPRLLTAREILQKMGKRYSETRSYSDFGVVKETFIRDGNERVVEKPFTTAFIRPSRFRFEYKEKKRTGKTHRYIVWRDGQKVLTWWDVRPGVQTLESLGAALAGATGVSSSSAHTIPALLLDGEVGGRRLTDLTDAKRLEDATCGAATCMRIEGKYAAVPMTIWVDSKTLLVRRIDTAREFAEFKTRTTTTYDPVIDIAPTDAMLAFNPPAESRVRK